MTVITISRQLGSHGEEIAAAVAQELSLRLVDAETINQAAIRAGVPQTALTEVEQEGERSLANQVLKALRTMPSTVPFSVSQVSSEGTARADQSGLPIPFAGLFSPLVPPISASLESYVRMVGLVIRGLAHEGDVLIVGRGGQILLRNHPNTVHVQIVAPRVYRTQIIMARTGLDRRAAQNRLRASDRARFDYLRRYHNADWLDATLYHLVLNTAGMSVATAVDLIITTQQGVSSQPVEKD
jgi:cytidylate kinase